MELSDEVTGLSRSEASDAKRRALGATPHRGLLDQPASYQYLAENRHDMRQTTLAAYYDLNF
jgi:hypothetical protein